jgi:DNA-binding transcriptional LysR family regulator
LGTLHVDTLHASALAGMGIAGLPSYVAEAALQGRLLERVLPEWQLMGCTIHAAMPRRQHVPARTRAFIDFLVSAFGGEARDPWLAAARVEGGAGAALGVLA